MPRPRPRPCHPRPRPRPRSRPSWGVLDDPRGQGQASRTTRLLEYAKQKLTTRIYVEAHVCCTCLDMITIWAAYITRTYVTNPLLSPTIHTVRTSIAVYIQEKTITELCPCFMCQQNLPKRITAAYNWLYSIFVNHFKMLSSCSLFSNLKQKKFQTCKFSKKFFNLHSYSKLATHQPPTVALNSNFRIPAALTFKLLTSLLDGFGAAFL